MILANRRITLLRCAHMIVAVVLALWGVGAITPIIPSNIASAHDVVVGGAPRDGEVLTEAPSKIVLEFSGEPKSGFNTLAVTDSTGRVLFRGEPTVEGRNVTLDVPGDIEFSSGEYTIGFQITSSDGHSTRGKTTFSIVRSGEMPSVSENHSPPNPSSSGDSQSAVENSNAWITLGIGVGIVFLLSSFVIIVLRNKKHSSR